MKKLAFIDPENKIEIHNFEGEWVELWNRGWKHDDVSIEGVEVRVMVRAIDDCLMVVGEEDNVLENARKVLKAEIG
jgi:hypothetical protein